MLPFIRRWNCSAGNPVLRRLYNTSPKRKPGWYERSLVPHGTSWHIIYQCCNGDVSTMMLSCDVELRCCQRDVDLLPVTCECPPCPCMNMFVKIASRSPKLSARWTRPTPPSPARIATVKKPADSTASSPQARQALHHPQCPWAAAAAAATPTAHAECKTQNHRGQRKAISQTLAIHACF